MFFVSWSQRLFHTVITFGKDNWDHLLQLLIPQWPEVVLERKGCHSDRFPEGKNRRWKNSGKMGIVARDIILFTITSAGLSAEGGCCMAGWAGRCSKAGCFLQSSCSSLQKLAGCKVWKVECCLGEMSFVQFLYKTVTPCLIVLRNLL